MTQRSSTRDAARLPPGPAPRRGILDSIPYYVGIGRDPVGFVGRRFATYGDVYHVASKGPGLFVTRHPDHMHDVLVTHASKVRKEHTAFRMLSRVLGDGLLTTDGDVWKRQRRMLQPAFQQSRLSHYADVMTAETSRTCGGWSDGATLEVGREMMELTLRIVSRALFSHDVGDESDDVARAMSVLQDSVGTPELLPHWMPTPHRRRFRAAVAAIDRIVFRMIRERRAGSGAAPDDLLQSLVTARDVEGDGGELGETEIRDQLVTLFLAGHETTSHALTWTWYLLSQNPEVERTLHAELDGVLGGRDPGFADLPRLPYTEQVVKESMRLYPPVYLIARRAAEDLEMGGYSVPKGSEIVAWVYHTHRDPRWYPEPGVFRPERFTAENEGRLPKLAYAPFGGGPRACIGKSFAMMESRLLLATIARRFRLELVPGHRVAIKPRVTLNPRYGMRMIARRRPWR
ncbi:MAG: cytochrome P450 [Deltaproteobacteria bacterium]|nr:cytochrome P450 [Deltaproteobacteria bacterium]